VSQPTRVAPNGNGTLIDLVLSSSLGLVQDCSVIPPLETSDHRGVLTTAKWLVPSKPKPCNPRTIWKYALADFEKANELLSEIDMANILDDTDVELAWTKWQDAFLKTMERCIPKGKTPKRKNLPWLSKDLTKMIKTRNRYFRRARSSTSYAAKYRKMRNLVVKKLREAKNAFFRRLKPNSKDFWKAIKGLNREKSSVPTLHRNGTTANTNTEKATLLGQCFSQHFNLSEPPLTLDDLPESDPSQCPLDLLCTEEEVLTMLEALDVSKSNGPDGISARMLKATAHSIAPAITKLFNMSIKNGRLPNEWKTSLVVPIPKKGDPSDPANYRPISLLPVLSKLLERHMSNLVYDHLLVHSPISIAQWGFLPKRSTTDAVLSVIHEWHQILDSGSEVCAVFFDLKKAFDSVPHRSLIEKLRHLNINVYVLRWITDYLTGRRQCVGVEGATSLPLPVLSGVPQGSVLGPLLFIIYIDGLTNVLPNGSISLYADDLLLYRPIRSSSDYQALQEDVDALADWILAHKLQFNCGKCKSMLVTRKRESITPPTVKVNDLPLERVYSYKYLGILITSDLSWSAHVATICSKVRQQIGLLYRRFYKYSNMDTLKQLYTAFVRPHLEYAVPVWDPHLTKDINALEAVQRFACRVCTKSWDMSYSDMLQTMNIPRLSERRRLLKMCHLYKIVHGFVDFPNAPLLFKPCTNYYTRHAHHLTLLQPQTHSNAFYFSFFSHAVSIWNSLPYTILTSPSINTFKRNFMIHCYSIV